MTARKRTHTELIKLFSGLKNKPVTDGMMRELINTMWPNKYNVTPIDASQVATDVTNFDSILSATEDTVQKALDVLDDHLHDDRYFTESEITSLLAGKSDTTHLHDDRYYTQLDINSLLSQKADVSHTHDDRYFTESEITVLLAGKSDTSHTHDPYTPGEGIDISLNVISGENASTTNKGIALFSSTNFTTSSGAVSIKSTGIYAANLNANIISGLTALTSGLASTDELMVSDAGYPKRMDVSVLQSYMQNSLSFPAEYSGWDLWVDTVEKDRVESTHNVNFVGGEGIDIAHTTATNTNILTLNGENASTTNKGIASFNTSNFSTSSGYITLKSGGVLASNLHTDLIADLTALTSGLVSTDELMVSDSGTLKKMDVSVLQSYMQTYLSFGTTHNPVTLGTVNGLSLVTQQLSLAAASTSTTGALTSTDWNTFNNKADSVYEDMDEITAYMYPTGSSYAVGIKTSTSMDVFAIVEVYILRAAVSGICSKAAYISFLFTGGNLYDHSVESIHSLYNPSNGATITIQCVDGGTSGYFRVLFSGLVAYERYDYKVIVKYIRNE